MTRTKPCQRRRSKALGSRQTPRPLGVAARLPTTHSVSCLATTCAQRGEIGFAAMSLDPPSSAPNRLETPASDDLPGNVRTDRARCDR